MPRNQLQKMFFAFVTVVVTVHAYVFYSLYVIHGEMFMQSTGATGVLEAINMMGGVPVLGKNIPIWAVVLIEFVLAYTLVLLLGSKLSFKIACHYFNPGKDHPFIAAILYYPYNYMSFNVLHFLAEWLKLVCLNFPFAFFAQLFFIQPFVRTVFKFAFRKDIAKHQADNTKEALT